MYCILDIKAHRSLKKNPSISEENILYLSVYCAATILRTTYGV